MKSQILRFHRICTQQSDFKIACKILFTALKKRGYTRTFLRKTFDTFLEVKERDESPRIALVSTYSTLSKIANRKIKRNFENRTENLLDEYKIIPAYRKNKNLKDYLVKSKLQQTDRPTLKKPEYFKPKQQVKNRSTNTMIGITQNIQATTKNCVYLITCKKCNLQYVGETRNTIADRLNQHRYNINNAREMSLVVQHFMTHGIGAMEVCGLQSDQNWTEGERRFSERQWILKLNTTFPQGLNQYER